MNALELELVLNSVAKTYPNGTKALDQVTLTIKKGMFGLLGPNGAGKSSLMRSLATLQEIDSGQMTFAGIDVAKSPEKIRETLGYLPQDFGVYPKVSAWDMLEHFAKLKGLHDKKPREEAMKALLAKTNLWEHRFKRLGGFSGGMKQRFGIAQALLGNPKLIIVDEPTAGLDPSERFRFSNLLSEISEDVIVILSTHIVSDVADLCQKMAIMNLGKVILQGHPLELMKNLKGHIYSKFVTAEELIEVQKSLSVIAMRRVAGSRLVHVFSPSAPTSEFEAVSPDLEDVYFQALWNSTAPSSSAQVAP
jgi:ABC-2 type transport system ATP-binding protein